MIRNKDENSVVYWLPSNSHGLGIPIYYCSYPLVHSFSWTSLINEFGLFINEPTKRKDQFTSIRAPLRFPFPLLDMIERERESSCEDQTWCLHLSITGVEDDWCWCQGWDICCMHVFFSFFLPLSLSNYLDLLSFSGTCFGMADCQAVLTTCVIYLFCKNGSGSMVKN